MNKFLTFAGTQPVYLGDIDFMQAAADNAVKQLAKALMDADSDSFNAILQGVELQWDSSTLTITPGVVVLNGELLPFEGVTLVSPVSLYFHVESTLSGERTFKDGESHKCHDTRKAIINSTSAGGTSLSSVPRLHTPSDDRVYNYAAIGGYITDAKLTKKSGFWFLEIAADIPDSSSVGSSLAQFDNLPSEITSVIRDFAVAAPIVLTHGNDVKGIQNMMCYCEVINSTVIFSFSIIGEQTSYGVGKYDTMLPIY